MDGVLNEPEWSAAESITLVYGEPGLLPTSGWRPEFNPDAVTDPTHATIKFLVTSDNQLWLGFTIPDSSIGGNSTWARWDAILMCIKDKQTLDPNLKLAPPIEYFYTWWISGFPFQNTPVVGGGPYFRGNDKVGNNTDTTRTPEQIAAWNAATIVNGTSNDAGRDEGWTVEMRIDLAINGYDVTQPEGDIVMLNFSIWDCDYLFEGNPSAINTTRTHFQSPFNAHANNVARVHAKPDVTTISGTLPNVDPDVVLPNNLSFTDPVIDGVIDEEVWLGSYKFEIAWDDDNIKYSYPGVGPWVSGHFQPGTNPPPVIDPSHAIVRMFFKNDYLYLAADVDDGRVQGTEESDKVDGIRYMIGDRVEKDEESKMVVQQMRINFDGTGQPAVYEFLQTLVDTGMAEYAVGLKGATTVNNNTDIDDGYQIELKIDLTGLGYPSGLGDKLIFMGADLFDGDSFDDPLNNYGSRTWWFREHGAGPALAWIYMDPNKPVGVEDEIIGIIPNSVEVYGNYPNPFNPSTTIKYSIPESGVVNVSVFNALGEVVESINLFNNAGLNEYNFNAANLSTGVYLYKISLESLSSGNNLQSKTGKMILLK